MNIINTFSTNDTNERLVRLAEIHRRCILLIRVAQNKRCAS